MRFEDLVVWQKAQQCALGAYSLILAKDLEYGDVSESSQLLEGVSKLLEFRSRAVILNCDS